MLKKEGQKTAEKETKLDSSLERFFDTKNKANIKAFDVPHNFFYNFQELFSDYNNSKFSEEYEEIDRDNIYIIDSIHSRECSFIKRFLFSPSKDVSQIQERGKIIEQLSSLENLDELIQIKNLSYDISIGIHNLVCLRGGYDDKERSLLERLAHGDKEMKIYDDDDDRCWGPPIGEIEILPLIQEEVGRIEKGFIILQQLTDSLTSQTDPILKKFFADMPSSIEKIKSELNILIPLKDSEIKDGRWWGDYHCGEKIEKYLFQIATLLEYARINRNEKWGEVTFDPNKPDSYIQGWNIKTKKNEQVRNDSPADLPVIVLKGPNTSGKSFFIDKDFLIRIIAQSLGRGPVDSANLHICNNFIYINRSTTDSSNNLSAFMKEVTNMKTIIPLINKNSRIWMDEGYSTTSSEDQIKLLLLTAQYVINKNAKIIIATHNDKKIDGASNYCLATDIDPTSGDLIRHFRLEQGSGDSQSLTVARMRNYPETTLHWSESYYNQKNELPIPMTDSKYQEIKTFTESERNQKKKEVSSLDHFFPENPVNPMFHLFSVDDDFSASHIFSGSKHSRKISSIESLILSVEDQKTMLGKMILWAPELSPAQKLERQKTISELIKDNNQEKLHESILKTIELDQIFSGLEGASKNGFLSELNPFSDSKNIFFSIDKLNTGIAFLNIQKKILKDNFQYEKMLNDLTVVASTYEQATKREKAKMEKNTIILFTELTNANNNFPKILFKDINIDEIKDELAILKETSTIATALDSLSQNLQESQSLIDQIKSLDSVYLHQAANLLKQEIDNHLNILKGKKRKKTISQDNDMPISRIFQYNHIDRKTFSISNLYGVKIKSIFYKTLEQIDALCLYADIAKQENKSPVIFNSTGEVKFNNLSNILTNIKDEKKNDVHFDPKKERVQILTGPNGSGKTSYEKGTIGAILEGNSIGYVSAEYATMPMFDGVAYLDRVTKRQDEALSSYAQEIEYFKELLPLLKSKKTLFVSIDEGFSTTSARYQEALSFGVLCEFLQSPHFLQFATHNHEFVDFFENSKISLAKPYHFKFSIVDNKIKWHYELCKGHKLSYGVEVAKTMGLSFD